MFRVSTNFNLKSRFWSPAATALLLFLPRYGQSSFVSSSSIWSASSTMVSSPSTVAENNKKRKFSSSSSSSVVRPSAETDIQDILANPPTAVTAIPGQDTVEEQPVRNPIDSSSRVLVIGGSRGIGLEFVRQCAQRGAKVIATHRGNAMPEKLQDLVKTGANNESLKVEGLKMDVGDETSITAAATELKSRDGFQPLTHIIHSAGIYMPGMSFDGTPRGGRKEQPVVTENDMMESYKVNAVGPLLVAQNFVPLMGQSSNANCAEKDLPILSILTSKVGSVHDNSSGGSYAYRASKSALNNIVKSLSVDLAGEISVVLLHPGYVRTDMTKGNGLIDVDESVGGMLRAIEATDATVGFRFVDFKACLIPW